MSNELIKKFEGFRSEPYYDQAGVATIGYGTTVYPSGDRVKINDPEITEGMGDQFLEYHVINKIVPHMQSKIHVLTQLNINQKNAIKSLIYNIGTGAFSKSTVLKRLNSGDFNGAADAFLMWNKVTINGKKVVSEGLSTRRKKERELFLTSPYEIEEKQKVEKISIYDRIRNWFNRHFNNIGD